MFAFNGAEATRRHRRLVPATLAALLTFASAATFAMSNPDPTPASVQAAGLTTLGNASVGTTIDVDDSSQFTALRVVVPAGGGAATDTAVYVGKAPAGGTRLASAIYADANGKPGNLVWGSALSANVASAGWVHIAAPNTPLAAGTYWVGFNATTAGTGFAFSPASSNVLYQEWWSNAVGTWPNPALAAANGIQPFNYSITLTIASVGSVPTNTPAPTVMRTPTTVKTTTATPRATQTATPVKTATPVSTTAPTRTPTTPPAPTPTTTGGGAATNLPPQGLYDDCVPSDASCLNHLNTMAAAGFKLVLNYSQFYAPPAAQLAYADRANSLGMKVIWGMNDPAWFNGTNLRSYYSDLGATCGCTTNAAFVTYVVNLVKNHPATWGYYIGDEATTSQHTAVLNFSNQVRAADANHPRFFVSGEDTSTLGNNLKPFVDTCDVCASDVYPIGVTSSPSTDPISNVGAVEKAITGFGKPVGMVLQSFSWGQYPTETWVPNPRWPTRAEMRQMRDSALNSGKPTLLLWYSYFDILKADGGAPGAHWADVAAAATGP